MLRNKKLKFRSYYSKLLCYFSVTVTVCILSVTGILYYYFLNASQQQLYVSYRDSLTQASYSARYMTEVAETTAMQIYSDLSVSALMYYETPSSVQLKLGLERLSNFYYSAPFIQSIYVYNPVSKTFYIASSSLDNMVQDIDSFFDKEVLSLVVNNKRNFEPIPRKISLKTDDGMEVQNVYTYIFNETKLTEQLIIINISEKWMKNVLDAQDINPRNDNYIIDDKGVMVTGSRRNKMLKDVSSDPVIVRILKSNADGYFIDEIDGNKSFITYVTIQENGWCYIRVTDYEAVAGKLESIRNWMIIAGILIALGGLLLSVFLAGKLYKPVAGLQQKVGELDALKKEKLQQIRREFLNDLIKGRILENEISEKLELMQVPTGSTFKTKLILLRIEESTKILGYNHANVRNSTQRELLYTMNSMLHGLGCAEFIEDHPEEICVLLFRKEEDLPERIEAQIINVLKTIKDSFSISISAAVSSESPDIRDVHTCYMECREALAYRLYFGRDTVIHYEDIAEYRAKFFEYPVEKEKKLIASLTAMKTNEALDILNDLIGQASLCSTASFRLTVIRILHALELARIALRKGGIGVQAGVLEDQVERIQQFGSVDEISQALANLVREMAVTVSDNRLKKHELVVKNALKLIENEFSNPLLSINDISERLTISSGYLGKIFRSMQNESFPDYLNRYRIEKSMEILKSTKYSIKEVSEMVGFNNPSYFFKVFKGINGITPAEYRQRITMN